MPRLRRADAGRARLAGLAVGVEVAIERQDQRNVLGDLEIVRAHLDPLRADRLDFARQMIGIEHDAVADHRELARTDDAGGQQRQLEHFVADNQRMAGVVTALETDDHVRRDGQPVDDLALALVAPLGADHHDIRHARIFTPGRRAGPGLGPRGLDADMPAYAKWARE